MDRWGPFRTRVGFRYLLGVIFLFEIPQVLWGVRTYQMSLVGLDQRQIKRSPLQIPLR